MNDPLIVTQFWNNYFMCVPKRSMSHKVTGSVLFQQRLILNAIFYCVCRCNSPKRSDFQCHRYRSDQRYEELVEVRLLNDLSGVKREKSANVQKWRKMHCKMSSCYWRKLFWWCSCATDFFRFLSTCSFMSSWAPVAWIICTIRLNMLHTYSNVWDLARFTRLCATNAVFLVSDCMHI